ncbi:MAG: nitroreductase family protein [Spirochaetota bacterium]
MMQELIRKSRSYRRFDESHAIDTATLRKYIDGARLSPTGGNSQPLKFMLSNTPERNALISPNLLWAALLKEWGGPKEGERPSAYIIILLDKEIKKDAGIDHGIAAQSIILSAAEEGLGGCMIGNVKRIPLSKALSIPDRYDILLVIALGKPAETVIIDDIPTGGDTKYYRTADGAHHVPKRKLDDIILS